jgi:TPR repeat protein
MYELGQGTPQDFAEALLWYRKAADSGNAKAQVGLGSLYYDGRGVPQDRAEAARWYRLAAEQGMARAEYDLGYMYYYGQGVAQDRAEANRWIRNAADQGDENALGSVREKLTTSRKLFLWVKLTLGLGLSLSFLSLNSFEPSRSLRGFRQRLKTGTGTLYLFNAWLGWYGYTHYKIQRLNCGFSVFTWFYWLLSGVSFALLFYIVLSGKKPGDDEGQTGEADPIAGSGATPVP